MFRMIGQRYREVGKLVGNPRSAPVPFSPFDLSPALWLDFSDASTLYQDSAKTTPVASDGDVIGAVEDKSGNGNDATQGTTANKPLYKTGIQNGKAACLFDGFNDVLLANSLNTIFSGTDIPHTLIAVLKKTGNSGADSLLRATNTADGDSLVTMDTSGTSYRYVRRDDAASVKVASGGTADTSTHLYDIVFTGTLASGVLDNAAIFTNADVDVGLTTIDRVGIGAQVDATSPLAGYFMEVLAYSSALSAGNMASLRTYLNDKWSIY